MKCRFLNTANCARVELCKGKALGTEVFQRRADEVKLFVVDNEKAVVEGFVVADGEFRVLRVEGLDIAIGNLAVWHVLFVVMLRREDLSRQIALRVPLQQTSVP